MRLFRLLWRLRSWFRLYFHLTDFLDLLANIALVVVVIERLNALSDVPQLPKPVLYSAGAYVFLTIWRYARILRSRRERDREQRESVCHLFHWLYDEMFPTEPDRRFTLFVKDPLDPDYIIPKIRYRRGHREPVAKSRARYRSGEGATGRAWDHANKLIFTPLRKFANRDEFTAYYVNELKIPRKTVDNLSEYMVRVEGIYSYGFLDNKGDLVGIVSIDMQGDAKELDLDQAERMIGALRALLEAFS